MGFWERGFTPKDTEEIRPGLFVKRLKGNKYKQVEPLVWNGKWRLRNQFGWRNILFIVLVFLIGTSYYVDTKTCRNFEEEICNNIVNINSYCFQLKELGFEDKPIQDFDFEKLEIEDDKGEDTVGV